MIIIGSILTLPIFVVLMIVLVTKLNSIGALRRNFRKLLKAKPTKMTEEGEFKEDVERLSGEERELEKLLDKTLGLMLSLIESILTFF